MKLRLLELTICCLLTGFFVNAQVDGLPKNAEPGKCYVKCVTPDEFTEITETIVVKPAYKVYSVEPAVYEDRVETVVVKEASKRYEFVPAVYETIEVPYILKEARTDLNPVAATFSPDTETREVYPKVSRFEYSPYPDCASPNPNDCQVLCWKEYPAQNRTISILRLASDAASTDVNVPEVGATYSKQVVKEPARYIEIDVPEVTKTITRQVLVSPARIVETEVPEETKTITKTVLTKAGGVTVWEELDCKLVTPTILPIFYDYNSAALRPESKTVIDTTVLALMLDKPNISVEIGSHTDSRGKDDYNQRLSQRRLHKSTSFSNQL